MRCKCLWPKSFRDEARDRFPVGRRERPIQRVKRAEGIGEPASGEAVAIAGRPVRIRRARLPVAIVVITERDDTLVRCGLRVGAAPRALRALAP